MEIAIDELRKISNNLFLHLEGQKIELVDIPADYYWNIPQDQLYNPYQQPTELDLGQLTDDWQELQKLLRSGGKPLGNYFVWLAAILRAVGENVPS